MIIRGTTPYQTFILPLKAEDIANMYVTYLQNGKVVVERDINTIELTDLQEQLENAAIDGEEEPEPATQVRVHLTQEETLAFKFYPAAEKNVVVIQIRLLTTENEAYASDPIHERVYGVLKDGVIGNATTSTSI